MSAINAEELARHIAPKASTETGAISTPTDKREKEPYRRTLQGAAYKLRKNDLLKRDGLICQSCKREYVAALLVIHHKNHDRRDHNLSNTELWCLSCNTRESNVYRSTLRNEREKKSESTTDRTPIDASWEGRRKLELEDSYPYLLDSMLELAPVTVKEAENRLAKQTSSDQQTVRRWIDRETTPEGKYELSERLTTDKRKTVTLQYISWKSGLSGRKNE
jgi:5-methylcytosine-specific restriction endonuclease McrA